MIFGSMTVSILGCGWYGLELAKHLAAKGINVNGSTTSAQKLPLLAQSAIAPYIIDLSPEKEIIDSAFFNCDVLWISIPPKARAGNGAQYLATINRLISLINSHNIRQVVLISSTGVYSDSNTEVNELTAPNPDSEAGNILLAAEDALKQQTTFTTTIIRFAGLMGPGRDPGRFFAGKTNIPNGGAPVNLIHLTDCIGISYAILDKQAFGHTFNATAPNHPTRAEFYTKAAALSGLELPQFINQKKSWKIVSSFNVPRYLGYKYQVSL